MIQPLFVFSVGQLLYFNREIFSQIRVFPYEMSTESPTIFLDIQFQITF